MPGFGTATHSEQRSLARGMGRELERPVPSADVLKKRKRLESDTDKWLRYFFPGIFRLPFGDVHHEIMDEAEYVIDSGGRVVIVGPRGTGKSYLVDGISLKALLGGRCRFPVTIPWKSDGLKKALSFWKKALCFNRKLMEIYPEWCYPFVACRGSSQKCMIYMHDGDPVGAQLLISEAMIVLPDNLGVIGGSTINGNPLGLHFTTNTGEGLRPDLIFIDDPQDKDTAMSVTQVRNTISVIDSDITGMAGPDKAMPMFIVGTVKEREDVMEHYLGAGGDWRAVRVKQIVEWPKNRALWDKWNVARLEGEADRDNGKAARAYYKKHKTKLQAGMKVSWTARFDKKRGDPDAFYAAMLDYYRMGHTAFMSERQNDPVNPASLNQYDLTVPVILSHMTDRPRLELPDAATVFCGHCDVNHSALNYVLSGFTQDMTGHCVAYGRWPERGMLISEKNMPEMEIHRAIFRGLKGLCDTIEQTVFKRSGEAVKLGLLLVDIGYKAAAVQAFCQQARYSFKVLPAIGRDAKNYRVNTKSLVGRPFEQCHIQRAKTVGHGPYLMFQADYWREVAQRAFLGTVGEPGGYTIHATKNKKYHARFAEECSAEKLVNKYQTDRGTRWEWTHKPGSAWDLGDAYSGSWIAAAASGLSASGIAPVKAKPKRARSGVTVISM